MRYTIRQKLETRDRILEAAAARFRGQGLDAVRVNDVMHAAGLTHGGFYKHFVDKEELFREAVKVALQSLAESITRRTEGLTRAAALRTVIEFYLSEEHMRNPEAGCAIAALGTEMARLEPAMKRELGDAMDAYARKLSYLMPGDTTEQREDAFRVLFPSMAGCIMTARAYERADRQQQLLAAARAFFTQAYCSDITREVSDEAR